METWKKVVAVVAGVAGLSGVGYAIYKHVESSALFAQYRKHGDVNGDGQIDSADLALIQAAYSSTPGSPNWNPNADLNSDGIVDVKDYYICAQNQGLTYQQWLKTRGYARRSYTVQTGIVPIKEI